MDRTLVLVPPDQGRVADTTPIEPGYPRSWKPDQMRAWASDLETLYRVAEQDRALPPGQHRLAQWRATPADQLPARAQELLQTERKLFDPGSGDRIVGSLLPDGRVEIDGGRHRAHYILERGDAPVPVWVARTDPQRVEAFRDAAHAEVARRRPDLMEVDGRGRVRPPLDVDRRADPVRDAGRVAVESALREPRPEVRASPEALERSRDRDVFRGERGR